MVELYSVYLTYCTVLYTNVIIALIKKTFIIIIRPMLDLTFYICCLKSKRKKLVQIMGLIGDFTILYTKYILGV